MSSRAKAWRPEGKTPEKVLDSLLAEANSIVAQFDKVAARHGSELEAYRAENPRNTSGQDIERWKRETLLKNLFEIAEPDEFDFDFHERRRAFFDQVESGADLDLGATFMDICVLAGIRPLVTTIVNAHEFQRLIYRAHDPHSPPEIDPAMLDLLEFDVTLLRLFIDAGKFYDPDQFLAIFMQKYAPS
jgi:hypothetical protein